MPFINGGHIWLILALIVLLVIFGPGKLPELGTAVGKTIRAFKNSTDDIKAGMSRDNVKPPAEPAVIVPMDSESLHAEPVRADVARAEPAPRDPGRTGS